jgi:molecular chaperone GrpE
MTSAQNRTREHLGDGLADSAVDEAVPAPADADPTAAGAPAGPSVAELEDRWRRAVAELDNLRKRFERQLAEQARAERARTAAAFLPVLDNLELALRHAGADPGAIVAGVQAVHSQALDALAALGYRRIDPLGERFDPARHDAARVVPAADGVQPGTIVEVQRSGYVDGAGTVMRPAMVTVAQAPASPAQHQTPGATNQR